MGVTLRSMIVAGLLIIAAALFYRLSAVAPRSDSSLLAKYPSFTAEGFHGEYYTSKGQLEIQLDSQHVEYFKQNDLVTLVAPKAVYYNYDEDESTPQLWQLKGNYGSYIKDTFAMLKDDIELVPLFDHKFLKRVTTSYLEWDLISNVISSDKLITIEGKNFINSGSNFKADLNTRQFTILGDPHARYYMQTPAD